MGMLGAAAVLAAFAWLFLAGHRIFLEVAHYGAAIPMFLLMVAVAGVNAVATDRRMAIAGRQVRYRTAYVVIAVAMLAVVVLAGGYALLLWATGADGPGSWLLVVETLLLVLFAAFWVLQTQEFWHDGVPEGLDRA